MNKNIKRFIKYFKLTKDNETHKTKFFRFLDGRLDIPKEKLLLNYFTWLMSIRTRIDHKKKIFLIITEYMFPSDIEINTNYSSIQKDMTDIKDPPSFIKSIESNPTLLHNLFDITYRVLDNIALHNEWWDQASPLRHKVILIHSIEKICQNKGHVYIYWKDIEKEINSSDNEDFYKDINIDLLFKLLSNKQYRKEYGICKQHEDNKITLKEYRDYEMSMIKDIYSMNSIKYKRDSLTQEDFESLYTNNDCLSDEQLKCINKITKYKIVAVTGQGGSGKTSFVVKYLCKNIISTKEEPILFLAPTHAAKKRGYDELTQDPQLEEYVQFKTIHSAVAPYLTCENKLTSFLQEEIKKGVRYIIIDEMSMIDLKLFSTFMRLCSTLSYIKLHIVLLGDTNQLDPVSIGCPFRDLLEHNMIQHCKLTHNFRSDGDISAFCKEIINSNDWSFQKRIQNSLPNTYNKDIEYYYTNNDEDIKQTINTLLNNFKKDELLPYCLRKNDESDNKTFQLLSYTNKDCTNFSVMIRNMFTKNKSDEKFSIGDPVIIKKNDKENNIYNGDEGVIIQYIESENTYKVRMTTGNKENSEFSFDRQYIKPSFVRTVHSSQGLQFPIVVYVLSGTKFHINKNINYTAFSRAKHKLILVGKIECFDSDKARELSERRQTFIHYEYSHTHQ